MPTQSQKIIVSLLIGAIKATSALTLIYFAALAVAAGNDVESGTHVCTGTTTNLVNSLKGETGEGTLAAVAAALVLLDLVFHTINTSAGPEWTLGFLSWGVVDKVQHALEFVILALSASVLHTLDLSDNGGGLQYMYKQAQCGDKYTDLLPDGLLLIAISFVATLVQFLILRVNILNPFGLQAAFDHITGDNCDE